MRRIRAYKSIIKERLLNTPDESESLKSLNNVKIEKIKEDVNKLRDYKKKLEKIFTK